MPQPPIPIFNFKSKVQPRKERERKEESLQVELSKYIKLQYKDVIFLGDMGGYKLPKWLGILSKITRSSRGLSDVWIFEPRGIYHGLVMELKKESPFKPDGTLKPKICYENPRFKTGSYDHNKEQAEILRRLNQKGYYAVFIWDLDAGRKLIDQYMKLKPNYLIETKK